MSPALRWCAVCKGHRKPGHEVDHVPSLFDDPSQTPVAAPVRAVDEPTRMVGRNHPETAQTMQRRVLPRSGSFRREVYDLIREHGGLTDDELEVMTGRSHQSASGARSTLKADGWLEDSGARRTNRYGNAAIVWVVTT